ncbi:GNAT family N-acetyltransferase [Corynebacterium liangguodongii]|uniref:GNAT family N-acetyltransferase n=1 Tax=Corynebacterium liangguodongii TaxID=2079535 RepID=UPI001F1B451B|nr:GNAT family N-acetyltransferase [Corynebacterium liangguodongii]
MTQPQPDTLVRVNPEAGRYEILLDGALAGFANFDERAGQVRDFNHTVVLPEFRGRGLSAPLIRYALDDTRRAGKRIIPTCSAVAGFVQKNPEYSDLVVG